MESFSALIVFSQTTSVERVAKLIRIRLKAKPVLLLTSHYLFENERQYLYKHTGAELSIRSFSEFPDDAAMEAADRRARPEGTNSSHEYLHRYIPRHLFEKNKRLYGQLKSNYTWGHIYVFAEPYERGNLGVSYYWWKQTGARMLVSDKSFPKKNLIKRILGGSYIESWQQKLQRRRELKVQQEVYLLRCEKITWIFFSIRRLHFQLGYEPTRVAIDSSIFFRKNCGSLLRKICEISTEEKVRTAVPLHEYIPRISAMRRTELPVYLFMDAFRPSNYPLPYYTGMFRDVSVVVRDMFDYELFQRAGFRVVKPFSFLKKNWFALPPTEHGPGVETIIMSLNHAGDWTALINRADTDLLVAAVAKLAAQFPNLNFIVRPHPTMNRYWNEGENSRLRIERFIEYKNLDNLSVSKVTMEEDWQRGDLFITEYSLSVIDAMKKAKIGLVVNLTGRRSFMADYEAMGFSSVDSVEKLSDFISGAVSDPQRIRQHQALCIRIYNQALSEFLEEPVPKFVA